MLVEGWRGGAAFPRRAGASGVTNARGPEDTGGPAPRTLRGGWPQLGIGPGSLAVPGRPAAITALCAALHPQAPTCSPRASRRRRHGTIEVVNAWTFDRRAEPTARGRVSLALVLACALATMPPSVAHAQSAENVAVVVNDESPVSQRVAEYYVQKRGIPAANVLHVRTTTAEVIERAAFVTTLEQPIGAAISRQGLQDRILYLVLTKGVPLRIAGTSGANGTGASVDSELALLYRRMTGQVAGTRGRIDNPYHSSAGDVQPFSHRQHDIYLVTRLDAFTEKDVIALIDRGVAPSSTGQVVLDQRDPLLNQIGEAWLAEAAVRLKAGGHASRVHLDATREPVRDVTPVLGYYSWGSMDPQHRVRRVDLGFAPGALAASFVNSDARTFQPPPEGWRPTTAAAMAHGGTAHSLIGDLIAEGVTGVAGHVAEPYTQSAVRPDVLFPAYFAGANLAEAFYRALPHLSWQTVVIGDPLCSPFRQMVLSRAEIEDPADPETLLPGLFGKRRLARVTADLPGVSPKALALAVRSEALLARGDVAAARAALDGAIELAPRIGVWQFRMASLLEQAGDYDAAIARYRAVLEVQPDSVEALNNLAYALAVHRKNPKEALPLARRAVAGAPQSPVILDTLAWVEHLLGNDADAVKLLALAVRGAPNHPEIRLHSAIVNAAAGARAVAETELQAALKLDPSLEQREEVRQLRAQLAAPAAR